ncbi:MULTISPECIES: helix-turn-helix domain-containing protein [Giesbergeria]|uniref:Helix-turn-helix domain-containing protein n=1 Tax=Giesbergeria sinuosa TaxID=80883 RepID=A0ABV9Q987_9BURK
MIDSNKTLWKNLTVLMQSQWGGENLNRLARECGVSPGTAFRLKKQNTSVGLDTLDKIAAYFSTSPHQLLDPNFHPINTPEAMLSAMAMELGHMLDSIQTTALQEKAYGLAFNVLQLCLAQANFSGQLSPMARDLGQMLDAIPDTAHQARAYALASGILQFGIAPPNSTGNAVNTTDGQHHQ